MIFQDDYNLCLFRTTINNLCSLIISIIIYLFFYFLARIKRNIQISDGERGGMINTNVNGYTFYIVIWLGISKKVIFFFIYLFLCFLWFMTSSSLSGSAWRVIFSDVWRWWVQFIDLPRSNLYHYSKVFCCHRPNFIYYTNSLTNNFNWNSVKYIFLEVKPGASKLE